MKRTSEFGSLYKGREGQWSWVAHRVTGIGILAFLFVHIVDTALVAWGPDAYNKVVAVYHHPIIQIMELGLVGAVHPLRDDDYWLRHSLAYREPDGSVRLEYKPVKLGAYVPMDRKY